MAFAYTDGTSGPLGDRDERALLAKGVPVPVDLVELPQGIGLPWSALDAVVATAVAALLVCLLIVVIDVCYLTVSAQWDQNDSHDLL